MANMNMLEEGKDLRLDFGKIAKVAATCSDVIPVAVQNSQTNEIILISYTNEIALKQTMKTRIATFWSTSRNELWVKGKTSGQYFEVKRVLVNCEQNSLVYQVQPKGQGICHTKTQNGFARNCFYRELDLEKGTLRNRQP